MKTILNSGDACYHSVQNLLLSVVSLLYKNVKIKIYRNIIFRVLYGSQT